MLSIEKDRKAIHRSAPPSVGPRVGAAGLIALVGIALALGPGCDVKNPLASDCSSNNTASISFGNRSNNSTYTIIWDGATKATIGPGQTSAPFDAAAGVAHTLLFRFSNTSTTACSASSPVPAQCSSPVYSCSA